MTGIIADTWKGIRVPGDPNSSFSLGGAEGKPAARAVPATCHHCLWAIRGFLCAGEDRQAASCPQQVPGGHCKC